MTIFINNIHCKQGQLKDGVEQGGDTILSYLEYIYITHNIYFDRPDYEGYAQTYKSVYNFIDKYFCLNIGGDHSIGVSTVQPLLDKYGDDVLIIWIDAHADINTQDTSATKNRHGMPVSCLLNLMPHWYEVSQQHTYLKPENIIYIGIRDLDPPEVDIIKKLNIKYNKELTPEILDIIKNHPATKVHISFDIDGLDPKFAPSTGTIAETGLSCKDVTDIIDIVADKLISMDLVEFNPHIGTIPEVIVTIESITTVLEKIKVT